MEDKFTLGIRLKVIHDLLKELVKDTGCSINVCAHRTGGAETFLHYYGDTKRMVLVRDDEVIQAFTLDRDDTVREEQEDVSE